MDKYIVKKVVRRKRQWVTDTEQDSENLNTTRGRYVAEKNVFPSVKDPGIRSYSKDRRESLLEKIQFPLFRRRIDSRWIQHNRTWLTRQAIRHFSKSETVISTSFQLPRTGGQQIQVVNAITTDLEFSLDSSYLLVASGCTKGGYVSVVKSSFDSDESRLNPLYNSSLLAPTVQYYSEPVISAQWVQSDAGILITRRACRELCLFDVSRVKSTPIVTLPYFVDRVIPCGNENCYVVAQGDGVLKMLDCRTRTKTVTLWSLDSPKHPEKEQEVVFSYKSPCTLNIVDIRNTHYSAITGKKSPELFSSLSLSTPSSSFPLSLHPFFSTNEVVSSLSDGSCILINRYTGSMRLHTGDLSGEPYHWDGITVRPFRPCVVSPSLYVPSPTFQSSCIRVYDFDTITPEGPLLLEIPCEEAVHGCCYSEPLHTFVVSCGGDQTDHHLNWGSHCRYYSCELMDSSNRYGSDPLSKARMKRAVKDMHIEEFNVNRYYDMSQKDSLVQPDESEMIKVFGDFKVRYRWIKFGDNIELISLTENDLLYKYGSIDPSKGISDVVDADEVDDSDPSCVHPCFFIAPENNICNIDVTKEEMPSEEKASGVPKGFEDDKNGYIYHPSERLVEPAKFVSVKAEPMKLEPVKSESMKLEPVKLEPVKPEPVKMTPLKPVQSPVTPSKSIGQTTPVRQVVPKKPVTHPVSAMSYQQRRQMYNTSRPGHSLPNPLLSMKPRSVTTKPAVVVGSNRLASSAHPAATSHPASSTSRPVVSALHPVSGSVSDATAHSVKLEHPSVTRQSASMHPTPTHPSTTTHSTASVHPTPATQASASKVSTTTPVTRLARNASSLPSYMRDTAASRAKQISTPVSIPLQRSTPVSGMTSVRSTPGRIIGAVASSGEKPTVANVPKNEGSTVASLRGIRYRG